MKFATIAVIASVAAFDVNQDVDQLIASFDTRLTELVEADDFAA